MNKTTYQKMVVTILFLVLSSLTYASNPSKVIAFTFSYEGGGLDKSSNHSRYGVSKDTLKRYNKKYGTSYTVSSLNKSQAYTIAKKLYYDQYGIEYIHDNKLAIAIFDFMYNSNPKNAAKRIEKAAKQMGVPVKVDGVLTKEELKAMNKVSSSKLAGNICTSRLNYMSSLKVWKKYKKGWTKRVLAIKTYKD